MPWWERTSEGQGTSRGYFEGGENRYPLTKATRPKFDEGLCEEQQCDESLCEEKCFDKGEKRRIPKETDRQTTVITMLFLDRHRGLGAQPSVAHNGGLSAVFWKGSKRTVPQARKPGRRLTASRKEQSPSLVDCTEVTQTQAIAGRS